MNINVLICFTSNAYKQIKKNDVGGNYNVSLMENDNVICSVALDTFFAKVLKALPRTQANFTQMGSTVKKITTDDPSLSERLTAKFFNPTTAKVTEFSKQRFEQIPNNIVRAVMLEIDYVSNDWALTMTLS